MMETLIGALIGIAATVVVSRYYYQRSVRKSLGVYTLLDSRVFSGIHPDVRRELHFSYRNQDVRELQQLTFLVANDGDRAISAAIEPLSLKTPGVEVLDASILHRHPESLQANVTQVGMADGALLRFEFPLLNRGDFFVVKILLSGSLPRSSQIFQILAEDLPRSIRTKPIPIEALSDSKRHVEWGAAAGGSVILAVGAWVWYLLYLVYEPRPQWFPYPWASFVPSIPAFIVGLPGALIAIVLSILGLMVLASAPFGGSFPPSAKPRFPLPANVRKGIGRYWMHGFGMLEPEFLDDEEPSVPTAV